MNQNTKCQACGQEIPSSASSCPYCGCPTLEMSIPSRPTIMHTESGNQMHTMTYPVVEKRNNTLLIVLIISITAIIICVAGFLIFKPAQKATDKDEYEIVEEETTTVRNAASQSYTGNFEGNTSHSDSRFHSFAWLSNKELTYNDISGLNSYELRILRNAIYAMHGYRFKSDDLARYFADFSWYNPVYDNVDRMLSPLEIRNIQFIKDFE